MDLKAELRDVEALLAEKRAKPPVAPKLSALPYRRPKVKLKPDQHRLKDRAFRRLHAVAGKCAYWKCHGEHCPGGFK